MERCEDPSRTAMLSRGEIEIELGRLALLLGNATMSERACAARRAGRPHPMIRPFLDACATLLMRTQPHHRNFVIRRLDRLAAAVDLGIIGLDVWLADHGAGRPLTGTNDSRPSPVHSNSARRTAEH